MPYVQKSDRPKKKTVAEMTPAEKAAAFPNTENAGKPLPSDHSISLPGENSQGTHLTPAEYEAARAQLGFNPTPGAPSANTPLVQKTVNDINTRDIQTVAQNQAQTQQIADKAKADFKIAQNQQNPVPQVISPTQPAQPTSQPVALPNGQTGTSTSLEAAPQVDTNLQPESFAQSVGLRTAVVTGATILGGAIGAALGGIGAPALAIAGGGLAETALQAYGKEATSETATTLERYNTARKNLVSLKNRANAGLVTPEQATIEFRQAEDDIFQSEQEIQRQVKRFLVGGDARAEFIRIMDYRRSDRQGYITALNNALAKPNPNAPVELWNADTGRTDLALAQ